MNARRLGVFLLLAGFYCQAARVCQAQDAVERRFPFSVGTVQAALKQMPGGTSGPLPVLDGFVLPDIHKLEQYKRPFYQCTVQVTPATQDGSRVRVTAKITAWNGDPAHPNYEVLKSNGRLEADLLDRLQTSLGVATANKPGSAVNMPSTAAAAPQSSTPAPEISAPMPQFPAPSGRRKSDSVPSSQDSGLEQEAKGLEELLQNQAHPTNLVAVKQEQTPLLQQPSSDAKVLFLASAEDEFEALDINPEWVHVRISGLSRGWLRRSSVELLDGKEPVAAVAPQPSTNSSPQLASKLYSVSGEEVGAFPGDWAPLKGKNVKIVSIQQAPGTGRITSPQDKLGFAEGVFRNEADKSDNGVVLIFDSEDGGVIAATRATLELWRTGSLSDQGFWKQCYVDPPEILGAK